MVHNKISIDRFFEVGGVCELILESHNEILVIYPPNREHYLNEILACGCKHWLKNERFWWDGWYYEPMYGLINTEAEIGNFYLFKTKKKR